MLKPRGLNRLLLVGGIAVLALSVTLKVHAVNAVVQAPRDVEAMATTVMAEHGFTTNKLANDPPSFVATRGECRVVVALPASDGYHQDVIRRFAGSDNLVYLFDGESFVEQPSLRTRFEYYWQRLLSAVGVPKSRSTAIAVTSARVCTDVPIDDLKALS